MRTLSVSAAALVLLGTTAEAATLTVGPGKAFPTPCQAIGAAQPNDTIAIDAGTYTDTCDVNVAGLKLLGVGGRPKINLTGLRPADSKAIYVINADNVTVENLELTGAEIDEGSGANGAGLRVFGAALTVRGCFIHDNQDGILGGGAGTMTIEGTEFARNGRGNGCDDGNGCTHNLYIPETVAKLVFQYNWSHDIATDTPDKGHLFKSRALQNFILYNRITSEQGIESYDINLPQGGLAVIVGNLIEKGANTGNPNLLSWGEEPTANADNRIFVVNNTFVTNGSGGTFINVVSRGVLTAHNNLMVGAATPSNKGPLSADNLLTANPMFVDQANYDYNLLTGSPAIDAGVDPGSADAFSLTPTREYVHPTSSAPRPSDGHLDVGAYEFGPPGTGGSPVTSSSTGAGNGGAGSGGAPATSSATGAGGPTSSASTSSGHPSSSGHTTGSGDSSGSGAHGTASNGAGAHGSTGTRGATGAGGAGGTVGEDPTDESSGCDVAPSSPGATGGLLVLALATAAAGLRRKPRR